MFPKLAVDPLKDLVAVTQVVDVPGVLVAHPSLPANSVQGARRLREGESGQAELRLPRQRQPEPPGDGEAAQAAGGLDMVHVPYKGGAGPAVSALVGGETHLMFVTASSAMPVIKCGPPQSRSP